ncbi:MAG TPA: ferritin-like domain-containing protein [Anaeromyxobacter sp.]
MSSPQLIAELSRLFSVEVDAVQAYAAAVALLGPGPLRDELALFGLEHQRHALVVQEQIVRRGYHPPDVTPDVKGVVIGALTAPSRPLGVEDILVGMRGNEQLTGSLYAKALVHRMPDDVRTVLARIHAEEQHHLDWVERTLSRRAWESAAHP